MKNCSKMSVHVAAVVLLQVIGVSEAFFLAEMFGPSAELEAACPGSCQVRKKLPKKPGLVGKNFIFCEISPLKCTHF